VAKNPESVGWGDSSGEFFNSSSDSVGQGAGITGRGGRGGVSPCDLVTDADEPLLYLASVFRHIVICEGSDDLRKRDRVFIVCCLVVAERRPQLT
jgi:hypothetical protein